MTDGEGGGGEVRKFREELKGMVWSDRSVRGFVFVLYWGFSLLWFSFLLSVNDITKMKKKM